MTTETDSDDGGKLSSLDLAGLIADALVIGGSISQASYRMAEVIVAEVIETRKKIGDYGEASTAMTEHSSLRRLASAQLAELIVDALLAAGLISPNGLERSRAIVIEEIDARKGIGDY